MDRSIGHIVVVAFCVALFPSCGNFGHGNFNKQKYTNLKQKTSKVEESLEPDLAEISGTDPGTVTRTDEALFVDVDRQTEFLDSRTERIEIEETQEIPQEETVVAQRRIETAYRNPQLKERRDFNKLVKEEQRRALIVFNKIFNSGLFLMILAAVIGITALFLLFTNAYFLMSTFALTAAGLVFIDWIMSMVALNRVRKIDVPSRTKNFRVKFRLAQLVAYIGVLACVVTLVGGAILGILWAAHVISF